jgi:LPPG:FO 2-phospho-L-lactate transferase
MRVTVLAGGVGAARFLLGLRELGHDLTVIGNVCDDITLYGLRVCPDLDTVMYTLGGGISVDRGWGRDGETFRAKTELQSYAAATGDEAPTWFGLGDRDLATHLLRTHLLRAGRPLSEVTRLLCRRWDPGVTLIPASDDEVETQVTVADGRVLHFQEWWVRYQAQLPAVRIEQRGASTAVPAPGVLQAIRTADVVLFPPSNPVVSIGAILALPSIADAVRATAAPVVGVSPIIGGAPVRGMADACLLAIGVASDAAAVARHYGARSTGGLIDGWLVDDLDKAAADELTDGALPTRAMPLLMRDLDRTVDIAAAALELAAELRR